MTPPTPETPTKLAQLLFEVWGLGIMAGQKSANKHYGPHSPIEMPQRVSDGQLLLDAVELRLAEAEKDRSYAADQLEASGLSHDHPSVVRLRRALAPGEPKDATGSENDTCPACGRYSAGFVYECPHCGAVLPPAPGDTGETKP